MIRNPSKRIEKLQKKKEKLKGKRPKKAERIQRKIRKLREKEKKRRQKAREKQEAQERPVKDLVEKIFKEKELPERVKNVVEEATGREFGDIKEEWKEKKEKWEEIREEKIREGITEEELEKEFLGSTIKPEELSEIEEKLKKEKKKNQ